MDIGLFKGNINVDKQILIIGCSNMSMGIIFRVRESVLFISNVMLCQVLQL